MHKHILGNNGNFNDLEIIVPLIFQQFKYQNKITIGFVMMAFKNVEREIHPILKNKTKTIHIFNLVHSQMNSTNITLDIRHTKNNVVFQENKHIKVGRHLIDKIYKRT